MAEISLEQMKAAVKAVHPDAHIADSLGVTVVVADNCVIGNSGMAHYIDGAEKAAWADAYANLEPEPALSHPDPRVEQGKRSELPPLDVTNQEDEEAWKFSESVMYTKGLPGTWKQEHIQRTIRELRSELLCRERQLRESYVKVDALEVELAALKAYTPPSVQDGAK